MGGVGLLLERERKVTNQSTITCYPLYFHRWQGPERKGPKIGKFEGTVKTETSVAGASGKKSGS